MGDTIVIETPVATVLEVSGLQGPQGPTGPQGPAGSVSGSIAWDNVTGKPSLVQSVNGSSGAVTVTPASIDAAEANHDHQPSDIYSDAVTVTATTQSAGEPNGVYFRDGSDNGKATYRSAAGYSIFWDDAEGEWVLGNVSQSHKYFIGSQDTTYPWQVSIAWTLGAQGSGTVPTVGQATLTDYQLNAAQDSVSTRVPKSGNATSTEVVLGSDTRLTNSRSPTSHAASHNYGGSDAVTRVEQARTLMDASPDNEDNVALYYTSEVGAPQKWVVDSPADFRTALELGTAATAATGDFAAASHTHELTALAATGATNGHVLTANGSNGVTFAALPASGVTGAASSASDVLGVSGANITGVDAGSADRLVFWDDSANKLTYLEAGSGLSISGTTLTASGGLNAMQSIAINFVLN